MTLATLSLLGLIVSQVAKVVDFEIWLHNVSFGLFLHHALPGLLLNLSLP